MTKFILALLVPIFAFADVTWEDYEVSMLKLALKVHASDFEPDAIVCIGRGGMAVGDAFSRTFGKTLGVVMASSYGGEGEKVQGKLNMAEHVSIVKNLKGNVLLLDDLVESGKTLKAMKSALLGKYPEITSIRTAVIYKKSGTKVEPDYFAKSVDQEIWIYQPNEKFDQISFNDLPDLKKLSDEQLEELARRMLEEL